MLSLGAIVFASPWVLLGLLALPAIWFLVRALPPRPRREAFPPIALLRRLVRTEPPPARTPPWLLLLRFLLAALLILALSGPVLNPTERFAGSGPLLLVVDDGWTVASRWDARIALLDRLLAKAAREERAVVLLTTAPEPGERGDGEPRPLAEPQPASELREELAGFLPQPFAPDHQHTAARISGDESVAEGISLWVSDGLAHPGGEKLEAALRARGDLTVFADISAEHGPLALLPLEQAGLDFLVRIRRPSGGGEAAYELRALAADGRSLATETAVFPAGQEGASVRLSLPQKLRNQVARIEIAGEASTGAAALLDSRSGRPLVGLAAGGSGPAVEPLRSPLYYLERALEPVAQTRRGDLDEILEAEPGVIILADVGSMIPNRRARLKSWLESGGLLIRFAGPTMSGADGALLPVRLRSGERAVGGALSWEEPQRLGPFSEDGPFAGLKAPESVTVSRQLLATPSAELADRTWARLADGTPLVTAERRGGGWLVLVHTTADPSWSSLALSGLFVDMLERLLPLAQLSPEAAMIGNGPKSLAPQSLLDGFGRLGPPSDAIAPIPAAEFDGIAASPEHPPGLYGAPSSPLALDLMGPNGPIGPDFRFVRAVRDALPIMDGVGTERDLRPPLLGLVMALALADLIVSLIMRGVLAGRLPMRRVAGAAGLLACLLAMAGGPPARAQPAADAATAVDDSYAVRATTRTRLGYVETGDAEIDRMTRAGLRGLARVVELRTAVRLGEAMAVDPERQHLSLFPLVYWPVPEDAQALSEASLANLERFMRSGGIAVFDTGVSDPAGESLGLQNPAARAALQRLLGPLALPSLMQADQEHVLGRAFYLMDRFPGRIRGRAVWVAQSSGGEQPEVSPVVIGAHDWPAAWAIDAYDHFLVPDLPGGRTQRELAFRFGVNLVMYALTGAYKADQLHLPALIERLGE